MNWAFGDLPMFGFDVGMIDCPWPFETYSDAGQEKGPEAHYQTMSMDDIAALPVGDLFGNGGLLMHWCTWPLIDQQAEIMRGWGFNVVTGGSWAKRTASGKLRWGTGYVLRSVCEPFLIGSLNRKTARGSSLTNMIETLEDAVIDGLAREHSRKPDEAYSLVEALTPGTRRVDLFSRQSRPGWTSWGNEATKFDEADLADVHAVDVTRLVGVSA
jgi:N6-adenosine-specific RNA methylase IME4